MPDLTRALCTILSHAGKPMTTSDLVLALCTRWSLHNPGPDSDRWIAYVAVCQEWGATPRAILSTCRACTTIAPATLVRVCCLRTARGLEQRRTPVPAWSYRP